MALPTVSDANTVIRSLLGDTTTDVWTDAVLLPYITRAYRKAARVLRSYGMGLLRKESTGIAVLAAETALTRTVAPTFPSDLLRPIEIREKPAGATTYTVMRCQQGFLTDATATASREYWDWREDKIVFRAASGATTLQIQYEAELAALTGNSSTIEIPDALDAVCLLASAYCAQSRDEQNNAAKFFEMAMDDLSNIASAEAAVKVAQASRYGRQ